VKIGFHSDSLGSLTLDEALDLAAELGMDCVELATGAWSSAPHVDLDRLLESDVARGELLARVQDRALSISALTCNGNQLDPINGAKDDAVVRKTITLAPLLGVNRVVLMSGLPGGPGDKHANWVVVAWPPEAQAVLKYQWEEVVIPYWRDLVTHSEENGGVKLCIEMHGQQLVYNVPSLLRLRDAAGPLVGANYDPSHLMWMGADPIVAIEALGEAIFHVHAKDTRLEPSRQALTSRLENRPNAEAGARSWNYVTLGYGNDESFWRSFCLGLRRVGYDDVLSIEHEDMVMTPVDGVKKSVELLRRVMPAAAVEATGVQAT
jgi:sugar phosphate isomerase/epimerase